MVVKIGDQITVQLRESKKERCVALEVNKICSGWTVAVDVEMVGGLAYGRVGVWETEGEIV